MSAVPSRSGTVMTKRSTMSNDSDELEAIPDEDTSEATRLFTERLSAWKHACGYLEDYITATEKSYREQGSQYEKILKTVSHPLKEGHHFDQNLGGVAGFFDNIRSNTQAMNMAATETAKVLKSSVLPTFARLHAEIKSKSKELVKGAGKGSKAVDKARAATQKQIELLGQHAASYDSTGGKISASMDPYLLYRGTMHRLNRQILEENANRQDIIGVQDNFSSFERHIIQTIQQGLGQLNSVLTKHSDIIKSHYGDMVSTGQRIPPDFEWVNFLHRNAGVLIDPDAPERTIENVVFPNQNHRSTIPLISGTLSRRGKLMRKYDNYYYAVTASKYLHEFKTDDDFAKEPLPEMSLFLPDCVIGAREADKFTVKGKDVSKGTLGMSVHTTHEFNFKAHTVDDAERWWEILRAAAGQVTNELPSASPTSAAASPIVGSAAAGAAFGGVAADHHAMSAAEEKERLHAQQMQQQQYTQQPQQTQYTQSPQQTSPTSGFTSQQPTGQHVIHPAEQNTQVPPIATQQGYGQQGYGQGSAPGSAIEPGSTTQQSPAATIPLAHLPKQDAGAVSSPTSHQTAGPVSTSAGPGEGVTTMPAKTG